MYGNVASPTGATVSLIIIAIIAVIEMGHVATADIGSAYIQMVEGLKWKHSKCFAMVSRTVYISGLNWFHSQPL